MLELSIRTASIFGYIRFGSRKGASVVDWDKAAREQKELNAKADHQRQLDEQRQADFWREVPAWSLALVGKFVAEAERYNTERATMPSEQIEISSGEGGVELRKLSIPSGFLSVSIRRDRDAAQIECLVAGNAPDGRAESKQTRYSAAWSPIGFTIRTAAGRPITEDAFVNEVMFPFARYISG